MLRSLDFLALVDQLTIGIGAILCARRLGLWWRKHPFLRLLLARPLWWLGARLLAVPDAQVRYESFRDQAFAQWELLLLGDAAASDAEPRDEQKSEGGGS